MTRLQDIIDQIEAKKTPPVHIWKPQQVGEIDIHIDKQGNWFHEGGQIKRHELVKLFSSILWFENGQHYLVTPVEKLAIDVADVPFLINQAEYIGDSWVVYTNTQDEIVIGSQNVVQLRQYERQWVPYVNVRYDLWARVSRSIYYQWAETAIEQSTEADQPEEYSLFSGGYRFTVAKL